MEMEELRFALHGAIKPLFIEWLEKQKEERNWIHVSFTDLNPEPGSHLGNCIVTYPKKEMIVPFLVGCEVGFLNKKKGVW